MNLDLKNKEWKEFVFEQMFDIDSTSSGIDRNKLINKKGVIPYLTRSEKNNGYDSFICEQADKYKTDDSNVITIGLDTQTVFYQPNKFYTGQNIQVLKCEKLNKEIAQFLIPLIKRQMGKFNWGGNGATLTRLRRSKLLLPINEKGEPDFEFMEAFMKQKEKEKFDEYKNYISQRIKELKDFETVEPIDEKEWREFFIEDVTEILSGRDIYASERIKGDTPYISATANNNGIGYFVCNDNPTKESGCLSVNRNGSVGYSFYHPYEALFSNDCRKLRLKNPNKHIGIFISQQITRQRGKYGYGYKMGTARLKRQKIILPINEQNQPDYEYMENYMKQLEYEKLKGYLDKKIQVLL
ncbi:MAG TPA: restriction endonuclease [Lutibacter sp.]|nr:restriction endonuclease [Lutibacter sp.]